MKLLIQAGLVSGFALSASVTSASGYEVKQKYRKCVVEAAIKIDAPHESAGDVADAAVGNDICREDLELASFSEQFSSGELTVIRSEARSAAVAAVLDHRAAKNKHKSK